MGELFIVFAFFLIVFAVGCETVFFPGRAPLWKLRFRREMSWRRVFQREVALFCTLAVIGGVYWLFPKFADADIRTYYHPFLGFLVPTLLVLGVPYFCLMDRVDPEEEDVTCRIGRALLTRRKTVTRFELANYARSWAVKAFWLSFMQPSLARKMLGFVQCDWARAFSGPVEIFTFATVTCYAFDLAYAAVGYLANFKLFNTHTRTAEPALGGWLAALCCYWPFWQILFHPYFFTYDGGRSWEKFFTPGSAVWWCWAGMVIGLELLYAAATVSGGLRFSNLTYRGLWNTGPYRWTKHPAYVFKNLSWWLISMPFLFQSGLDALRGTVLLLGVSVIYYLRARTEEQHLSHYPEYVAYALKMNKRSIFRFATVLLPFLKYRAPAEALRRFAVVACFNH